MQVVRCDEAMRAVTLTQSVPGGAKQSLTRTYHFDKVGRLPRWYGDACLRHEGREGPAPVEGSRTHRQVHQLLAGKHWSGVAAAASLAPPASLLLLPASTPLRAQQFNIQK